MALGLELRRALDLGRRGGPLILILELRRGGYPVPPGRSAPVPGPVGAPTWMGLMSWLGITLRQTRSKVSKSTTARSVSWAGAVCLCSTVAPSLFRACARLDSPHPMRRRGGWIQLSPFSRLSDFL